MTYGDSQNQSNFTDATGRMTQIACTLSALRGPRCGSQNGTDESPKLLKSLDAAINSRAGPSITFLLLSSYAAILFNAVATVASLFLIDRLGDIDLNEARKGGERNIAGYIGRPESSLQLLCQFGAHSNLAFLFFQCDAIEDTGKAFKAAADAVVRCDPAIEFVAEDKVSTAFTTAKESMKVCLQEYKGGILLPRRSVGGAKEVHTYRHEGQRAPESGMSLAQVDQQHYLNATLTLLRN
ncbi:hypothetical protein DFH07DRAFT_780381 [Mycena maculata]|uniref:Uncharacterized protein n=1 Tax=Mycena maculata TaxID=230809 RepID=A0AAD7I543_9AGAR|nr:hypothetical protein DFH07DRAFT_780381 [Mycena maculata]